MSSDETKANKPAEDANASNPVDNNDADETKDSIDKKEEEESIYTKPLQNQVSVARNHPLSYYVDRSRRILRKDDTLIVKGRGTTISMACTLVEVLKRQKIAEISKVNTAMDIQSYFSARGETRWTNPAPLIKFELVRGEFATCVSDYHQRKVIEIFEKQESTKESGLLSYSEIDTLNLASAFKAEDDQLASAKSFLKKKEKDHNPPSLDLPDFIRYASILIHPLLKDRVFKNVLKKEYGIDDDKKSDDNENDDNQDHQEHDDDDMENIE